MDLAICLFLEEEEAEADFFQTLTGNGPVNPIYEARGEEGCYPILIMKHLMDNHTKFREYFRLSPELFDTVLKYIKKDIYRPGTNCHPNPISPHQKLCVALRYLATGESFRSLSFQFRISFQYISKIVKEVLDSIKSNMFNKYLPEPTEQAFSESAQKYSRRWNFPNAVGAIDGKHIRIVCPDNTGSLFYNYKNYFSIILLAIVGADYKFISVDVGDYGKNGDAYVFEHSNFGKKIKSRKFNILPPSEVGSRTVLPHVLVGDEAFALDINMMKPYSQKSAKDDEKKRIFNYRLSRARRTTENAFGILTQVFRIFYKPIACDVNIVDSIVVSACILHNMLRDEKINNNHQLGGTTEEMTEQRLPEDCAIGSIGACTYSRHSPKEAKRVRQQFVEYFNSVEGSVPWQLPHIRKKETSGILRTT